MEGACDLLVPSSVAPIKTVYTNSLVPPAQPQSIQSGGADVPRFDGEAFLLR